MGAEIIELENSGADQGGYALSRLNAVRHGILSRHAILPWEDQADYDKLAEGLVAEYQPATPTECHLVEELTGIIWRKARVRVAEGSAFRREAARTVKHFGSDAPEYVTAALVATTTEPQALKDGITSLADNVTDLEAQEAAKSLAYWEERQQRFEADGLAAAQSMLDDEDQADWKEYRQQIVQNRRERGYTPHKDDQMFADWLGECVGHFRQIVIQHQHTPAIRQQIIGMSYATERMDGIARYETHLDRKFERILAMLIKLREMQGIKRIV